MKRTTLAPMPVYTGRNSSKNHGGLCSPLPIGADAEPLAPAINWGAVVGAEMADSVINTHATKIAPDYTLPARLARMRGGEHEAEAEGDYDTVDLDQACGNAYRSGQLMTLAEYQYLMDEAIKSIDVSLEHGLKVIEGKIMAQYDAAVAKAVQAEREACAKIIAAMTEALTDISHGNGMFGLNPMDDLKWAMQTATAAIQPQA